MTKFARLAPANQDGNRTVIEIVDGDPKGRFHPTLVAEFIQVPDSTTLGSVKNGQTWTHPDDASGDIDPPAPVRRLLVTPSEFRNSFSAFEEVAIVDFADGADDPANEATKTIRKVVGVFFDRLKDPHLTTVDLSDPRNLAGLDLLVSVQILTAERRNKIAAGLPT